jgi:multidrug resistance efflux pump
MKSINFKRQEVTHLKYLEENLGTKKKDGFNWDRIVYLSILALIIFFVLRYFYLSNFYITANGSVYFESVEMSLPEDIRIDQFFVEEGETIQKGDTLFTFLSESSAFGELTEEELTQDKGNESNWQEREAYSLKKSISLNNSQIRADKTLMATYQNQLKRMENEVIVGTASERDLANLEYQIGKLETSISLKRSENGVLARQLSAIQENAIADYDSIVLNEGEVSPYRVFKSPIAGYISRIYREPYEIALKSQSIINIHQADSVHIKGYFEQQDLKYVAVGDIVDVSFPDGKESKGIIKRFYSATVLLPEEFQEKYEPVKRTIAVDVSPAPGADVSIWKRYYKLSVHLTKRTF